MVEPDIEGGSQLVDSLRGAAISLDAAFWGLEEGSDEWRLFIASREFDQIGPKRAYSLVRQHLHPNTRLDPAVVKVINPSERMAVLVPGMARTGALRPNTLLRDVYIGQTYYPAMYIYLLPAFA